METTTRRIEATARTAGKQIVHTVRDWDGNVVATRRSAHRYFYAICQRRTGGTLIVSRWSRSAECSGAYFAVRVTDEVLHKSA